MKRGWVGFERRLKGLRQRQNRMKSEKLTWQQTFQCEPAQIKSYCKKQGDERPRNYETRRRRRMAEDSQPTGRHRLDSRGPHQWMVDRKGRVGTHLCGRRQPCETEAPRGHLSGVGTAGNRGNGSTAGGRYQDSGRTKGEGK